MVIAKKAVPKLTEFWTSSKENDCMYQTYFSWLAGETKTLWTNDSAIHSQVEKACAQGAIGVTTNPPIAYDALSADSGLYSEALAGLDKNLSDDEYAFQATCLVAKHFSEYFRELHEKKGGLYGGVRAQVAPKLRADARAMLGDAKRLAAIGKNMLIKIPGTKAGIFVLEELAALGISTTPTVIVSVAQAIAAAEAFERGRRRAIAAGLPPPVSSCAIIIGRLQDYFVSLNEERNLRLAITDLESAVLAVFKRCYTIFREKGYHSILMPAGFRALVQLEQLAGGEICATIGLKIQEAVEEADKAGTIKRGLFIDDPVDEHVLARVSAALPEFQSAYKADGLTADEFDTFGAEIMTLDGFHEGWKKLVSLKYKK
jgi:transaldolase